MGAIDHTGSAMTSWGAFAAEQPEFAARVRELFTARKHLTMATLRRDGSPRISGTEVVFGEGGLSVGMMAGALKARDLQRDPRVALHSPTADPPEDDPSGWTGEAKISGRAVEVPDPEGGNNHFFAFDITEVVLTSLDAPGEYLVIESWHPGRGLERHLRK